MVNRIRRGAGLVVPVLGAAVLAVGGLTGCGSPGSPGSPGAGGSAGASDVPASPPPGAASYPAGSRVLIENRPSRVGTETLIASDVTAAGARVTVVSGGTSKTFEVTPGSVLGTPSGLRFSVAAVRVAAAPTPADPGSVGGVDGVVVLVPSSS
jgi:hypothetical protein